MRKLPERLFGVNYVLKPADRLGDLPTARNAYRQLLQIAAPSVIELVFTSLIGSIDTMMVGTLGSYAIASVGLTGQPWLILLVPIMGIMSGVTAVVARRKGEDRREDAGASLRLAILLGLACALLVTAAGILFSKQFMMLAGAKSDTLAPSAEYFRIRMYALPVCAVTWIINASQRGIGNTKITLYTNLISNGVNIFFNYMLIGGHFGCPALGVAGAALATDIGMVCGLLAALVAILRPSGYLSLRFRKSDFANVKPLLSPVLKVGSSAVLEQIGIRVGFLLFSRMVADLGTQAFAAHQVCMQFLGISFQCADGIGVAGTALVGFNLGKKRPDLARLFGRLAQRVSIWCAILIAACVVLFRYPLVRLFTKEADVIQLSVNVMLIVALFQPFQMPAIVTLGNLRGAGDTKVVARITMLCIMIIRPATCAAAIYLLHLDLTGAWLASLVEMIARMTLGRIRFNSGKWTSIRV